MSYNPAKIEKKWQKAWEKTGIYLAPDKVKGKKNFYHLVMLPYTSGDLHIGHWYNFAPADVYARFKRMQGFNVMSPIGFDAFGLPAENAAIKNRIHPKTWTYKNIKKMKKQLRLIGAVYDWSREIITSEPNYYKWTQWMFLQLYKKGLAYRAKVPANWCPSCKTVLANEQVVEGKCERCESEVFQKEIEQWLFKITESAEDLLENLEELDWPENTKTMQRNWIGKSLGWEVKFKAKGLNFSSEIPVFTTRTDTLFGATYLVLAPEHKFIADNLSFITNQRTLKKYIEESKKKTERERISEVKEKTGIEVRGIKAINPVNNREIPIFVADYVLMNYGTGAIMSVPAQDQRDYDFAKKYNLPIIKVVKPKNGSGVSDKAYEGEGVLMNSGRFIGMKSSDAKERIGEWLSQKGLDKKKVYYKLRDWTISRQRYWGAPIPMVFCQKCGWQPVKERDLPVLLPKIKDFRPTTDGKSPLAKSKKFLETFCPKCNGPAKRETDTMDTFVCSSWYYLRYTDSSNEKIFASKQKIKTWLPVNMYIGGSEHIVLHLLYSRFFTRALKDFGYLSFKEPFLTLRHQGIILGSDGQKMSKSKGNIIDPDIQVRKYGSDVIRMYLCFMGPYNQGGPWNIKGIGGVVRFLKRVSGQKSKIRSDESASSNSKENPAFKKLIHQTIKKVKEDIEGFRFNTAISSLMILINAIDKEKEISVINYKILLRLLSPFAPHLTEQLWQEIKPDKLKLKEFKPKDSIHNQPWPEYNPKLITKKQIYLIIQINGRVRDKIEVKVPLNRKIAEELAFSSQKVGKWIKGKKVKRVIFVPGKLINIVI